LDTNLREAHEECVRLVGVRGCSKFGTSDSADLQFSGAYISCNFEQVGVELRCKPVHILGGANIEGCLEPTVLIISALENAIEYVGNGTINAEICSATFKAKDDTTGYKVALDSYPREACPHFLDFLDGYVDGVYLLENSIKDSTVALTDTRPTIDSKPGGEDNSEAGNDESSTVDTVRSYFDNIPPLYFAVAAFATVVVGGISYKKCHSSEADLGE
jgi:hypothetical protein